MNRSGEQIQEQVKSLLFAAFAGETLRHYQNWRAQIDFDNISFAEYYLLAKVYDNLCRTNFSDDLTLKIKGIARRVWLENQLYIEELKKFFEILAAERAEFVLLTREPLVSGLKNKAVLNYFQVGNIEIAVRRLPETKIIEKLGAANWRIADDKTALIDCEKLEFKNAFNRRVRVAQNLSRLNLLESLESAEFGAATFRYLGAADYLTRIFETEYLPLETRADGFWVTLSALIFIENKINWEKIARQSFRRKLNFAFAEMLDEAARFQPSESYAKARYKFFEPPPRKLRRIVAAYRSLKETYRGGENETSLPGFARFLKQHWKTNSFFHFPFEIGKRIFKS